MSSLFPDKPVALPMPPPSAHPATLGSAAVGAAGTSASKAAGAAEGLGVDGTIQTTPEGLTQKATTNRATLLGQ